MEGSSWPGQRLRLAFGCLLFFVFELAWGKQLPPVLIFLLPGIGFACLISAWSALKTSRLEMQLATIRDALEP